MEYRNFNHAKKEGESRDGFDSRIRKAPPAKKNTGTENTSVPAVTVQKKKDARDEFDSRVRTAYGNDYSIQKAFTDYKAKQDEEDKKRAEAKRKGEKYIPEAYIMGDWYFSVLGDSEKRIKKLETDAKTQEKELTLLDTIARDLQSRYAVTGSETDRAALERANKRRTEKYDSYLKTISAYNSVVEKHNTTVGEFTAYRQKEEEALGKAVRGDTGQIKKELDAAERTLELYKKDFADAVALCQNERYREQFKKKYEEWIKSGKTDADIMELNPYKAGDMDVWFYYANTIVENQQKRVAALDAEWQISYQMKSDFGEKSKYVPTKNGKAEEKENVDGTSVVVYSETGFNNIIYDYINKNPDAVRIVNETEGSAIKRWQDWKHLQQMTETQVAIFNYKWKTEGQDAALAYAKRLEGDLKREELRLKNAEWEKFGEEHKILGAVSQLGTLPGKIIAGAMNTASKIFTGKIDEYAGYNDPIHKSAALGRGVTKGTNAVDSFLYNTTMGILDFAATYYISKGIGKLSMTAAGGSAISKEALRATTAKISRTLMGSRTMAETAVNAKLRGLDDNQAFALGVIAAGAEAITEKYSLDALFDDGLKGLRYIGKNALTEASEEAASSTINFMADILYARDKSEWSQAIKYYQTEKGYDYSQAFGKAFGDQLLSLGLDALAGAISGGVIAGSLSLVNSVGTGAEERREIKTAVAGQYEAQKIARENAEGKKIVPMAAQKTAEGYILPTAKETMAAQGNGANANATAMDAMTDAEYDAQMDVADAEASMAGASMLYDDGRQFLIKKTEDNQNFVEVEGDILQGVPKKQWIQTVKDTLKKKFPQGVTIRNDTIKINAKTRGEITNSEYTRWIADHSAQKYADKLRATNNADEIIEAASNWTGEAPLHDRTDNIVEFARGDVLMRIGQNGYSADVVVATTKDGSMLLYDIVNMEPTVIKEKSQTQTAATPLAEMSDRTSAFSSNDSISQTSAFSQENSAQNPSGENVLPTAKELDRQRRAAKAETETERTGILLGVPEKIIRTVQRLAKIIGKEVVFYRNTDGKVKNDLGYYNHNDGKIYLNADAENPAAIILGHEMVHAIQLTDGYISFFKTVLRKMQADGINLSEARAELKARYAKNGVDLDTTAKIDQDLVAEYAQKHLFTDEASIASIVNADKESSHKILNFLDRILAKLGNKDARERAFVQKARALYAKALRESREMQSTGWYQNEATAAKSMAETKTASETMADARGETAADLRSTAEPMAGQNEARTMDTMTDAEYDARLDVEEAEASMAGESMLYDDGRQFMIGGTNGLDKNRETEYNIDNMPIRPAKPGNPFPPYNESFSDANERATRWAHRDDVKNGDRVIATYHGQKFTIEKDENTYLRYKIIRKLTKKGYLNAKQYYEEVGADETDRAEDSRTERVFSSSAENRGYHGDRTGRSGNDSVLGEDSRGAGDVEATSRGTGRGTERAEDITRGVENQQDRGTVYSVGRGGRGRINDDGSERQYAIAKEDAAVSQRETSAVEEPETMETIAKTYGEVKRTRRELDKVNRRMRLSDEDKMHVGRLLRGEILPEHLPEGSDTEGILAVYEAKREYEGYAKRIRAYNQRRKDGLRAQAQEYLGNIQKWKDKTIFGGLRYSTETMERNFQDVMGEDADAIIEEYLKPVHKATASSTALKNEMRGRVEKLNLSRKVEKGNTVSEAHAVQLLGEAEDHIRVLKVMGPDATRDGKTLSEWETVIGKLWKENPNLDEGKIRGAIEEFRKIYDELFERMNETRVRNGYEPVNYRSGYFPHFQPGDEGVLAQFGRALGIDTAVSALPTTINGMTHIFRPGIQWLGNAQERIGFNTVYDAVEGFDKYIEGVADVIHMTDSIQKLRALAREIRYEASDEGIKKQVDKIEASEDLTREEKDALIQSLYEKGKFALGNFVVELDEYTNLLANKKSRGDREMERKLGREWYNIMRRVNSNVAANMTALNIPSWLTNFIPLTQAWGLTDSRYMLRGMAETIKAYKNGDDFVSRSTFLTNRRGSDPIIKAWEQGEEAKTIFGKAWRGYQAGIGKLSGGMEFIDQFTADSIVRAKYYQNIDAGMSEEAAMDDADAFAAGVMADRSKGGMPTIFHETNPIKKLFTQFQIEVNNQYRYLFKDMPREMQGKGAVAMAAAFLKVFLGAFVFNELYELLFGRRAAFDPAGIIKEATEDAKGENGLWNGAVSLAKNVSEELPFIGGLLGGGRVPISSALPDVQNLSKALLYDGWDGKKRLATAAKEVGKPLFYTMLPGGGGQIKKVVEGIDATVIGGSYTMDADGNDVLQYPIYNDTPAQAIGNGLRATIFGKSTLPTAKDWVDGGFKSLSAKDTEIYRTLLSAGVQGKDAFPAVQAVRDAKGSSDKRDAIRASGLPEDAKKILYRSKVSDKWDEGIATLEGVGITFDEFLQIQNQYTSAGEAKDDDEATAVTFARWLNTTPYSEEQKAVIKETFRASAGSYDKFTAVGLNDEKAAKLTARLEGLKPEEGKEKVSSVQKYKAIVTAGLPEKDQMAALSAVMSDGDYAKVQVGYTYSVTPVMYVTFKERLDAYDEDGNGGKNQKEVTNAIRNMSGGMNLPRHDGTSFNLTNKQKAVLWQLANKSWKAKNNPFDTSVGLQVYNALHAE